MQLPGILVRQGHKEGKGYSAHITKLPTGKYMASITEHNKEKGGIVTKEVDTESEANAEISEVWKELGLEDLSQMQ
ncbi:hypothetical protein [Paenibacillus sp. FSL R7-0333]|uniref:hypothetical protein n=1 Tax=Paenibacillus sp. FSL R7-0333 TaxID=1926587 RepID=UPI00096BFB2C|nr:hypothetical protein BK146_16565 [Paenibacillus sp. FSL R7-0333]